MGRRHRAASAIGQQASFRPRAPPGRTRHRGAGATRAAGRHHRAAGTAMLRCPRPSSYEVPILQIDSDIP
eukprot:14101079-Alexandrium_andersonii.AAC.1